MYHNCNSLYSVCEGKEGNKTIYITLFSCITGMKTNMLLIIVLGIIAKLTLVSGHCDFGNQGMDDFYLTKVSISLFIRIM